MLAPVVVVVAPVVVAPVVTLVPVVVVVAPVVVAPVVTPPVPPPPPPPPPPTKTQSLGFWTTLPFRTFTTMSLPVLGSLRNLQSRLGAALDDVEAVFAV
ncbi:hypothetical protein OHS81_21170 [Streptomyces sp. NBC_00400]|uniref:hypothetical protein n=1 Tax=Streptomyces sp. NBC_00400 TaxID=2975737 RepID=UPI002E1B68CC